MDKNLRQFAVRSTLRRSLVPAVVIALALLLSPDVVEQSVAAIAIVPPLRDPFTQLIRERVEELGIPPRTVILPTDQALQTANEIRAGHYESAGFIAQEVLASSQQRAWRFYPFGEYMNSIFRGEEPALGTTLDRWLAQEPNSVVAHLMRGMFYANAGRIARGTDTKNLVPARLINVFADDMARSIADLQKAIRLDNSIPWSYSELERVSLHMGNHAVADDAFREGSRRFPSYYPLYKERLLFSTPKWGGSVDAMYRFVDQYVGAQGAASPLKLLYLDLYTQLVDAARFTCGSDRGKCFASQIARTVRPALARQIQGALGLFSPENEPEFSAATWKLLYEISCPECTGSAATIGANILQAAADVMGSDNRLMDHSGRNSYVLDEVTAHIWAQMGNPANADKKFHEALRDVERATFVDPRVKVEALAGIYADLETLSDNSSQFVDEIVYHDAVTALAGDHWSDTPWKKCYALYRLKRFQEATTECTALVNGHENYQATFYWRGQAYEQLGNWDESISDLAPVADGSDNWLRVGAALDASYDFGQKKDFAGQLRFMNAHAFLFDPSMQSAHDLAVAYNNRCFALMQLGQLRPALTDCTQSLKYDQLPDALQKRHVLLRQLHLSEEAGGTPQDMWYGAATGAHWPLYALGGIGLIVAAALATVGLSRASGFTEDLDDTFHREVGPGERLLWSGIPQQGLRTRPSDAGLIPFSIVWFGFAVFWEYNAVRPYYRGPTTGAPPWFFALWGIPFVLMGLYMLVGRFFAEAWMRSRTRLAVTSRRIIIVTRTPRHRVRSLELRTLSELNLQEFANGRGTISFGPVQSSMAAPGWPRGNGRSVPAFEGIEHVRQVYELIRAAVDASQQAAEVQR